MSERPKGSEEAGGQDQYLRGRWPHGGLRTWGGLRRTEDQRQIGVVTVYKTVRAFGCARR